MPITYTSTHAAAKLEEARRAAIDLETLLAPDDDVEEPPSLLDKLTAGAAASDNGRGSGTKRYPLSSR